MKLLTADQTDLIDRAARLLPLHDRKSFAQSVHNKIAHLSFPTTYDISDAVAFILAARGIAVSRSKRRSRTVSDDTVVRKNKRRRQLQHRTGLDASTVKGIAR
jgi:hypothetical protein